MLTVIVKYQIPGDSDRTEVAAMFKQGADGMFKGLPHLYSKQFCFDETSREALSVYLWETRSAAEAFFNDAFVEAFSASMGCVPNIAFYDNLVTVDNRSGDVLTD
jgi:hypothetical protein